MSNLVTLKDLMNPLSKIEEYSKSAVTKLNSIESLLLQKSSGGSTGGLGVSGFISGQNTIIEIQRSILNETINQTRFIKLLAKGSRELPDLLNKKSENASSNINTEAVELLETLGIGVETLGKGFKAFRRVPKKVLTKFTDFIGNIFERLNRYDTGKVREGIEALHLMGGAIFKFSSSLAISALLLIPGMIAIPFLITSIGVMGFTIGLLGSKRISKRIDKGSESLGTMGSSILKFGIGIGAFALSTMFILKQPDLITGMVASILSIGVTVSLLGSRQMSRKVRRGAIALGSIGAGLISFAIGYSIFRLATLRVEPETAITQSLVLLGIGTAVGVIGKFGLGALVKGSIGLGLMGIGMLGFSLGYIPFAKVTQDIGFKDIFVQSGLLLGIGTVMSLAGLAVAATGGAALLGPVLFGLAGASLMLLAPGLEAMKKLDFGKSDTENMIMTLGSVAAAFSGVDPNKEGVSGFLSNVGGVFGRVVQSGVMGVAAANYILAGLALNKLSDGLSAFKNINFKEKDSKNLYVALGSISSAFASVAGEGNVAGGGFFGTLFNIKRNAVAEGIRSVRGAGNALIDITKGLMSFQNLVNDNIEFGDKNNPREGTLGYSIINSLAFVQSAFASVGGEGNVAGGGFFGSLFNIKRNAVAEGIKSVEGAGSALIGIAEGLVSFQSLVDKEIDWLKLRDSVKFSVGFVQGAFASIASEGNVDSGGFFGTLFGIKRNAVSEGIKSVKGAGSALVDITEGLVSFQSLVDKEISFEKDGKLANAVRNSLMFVQTAFEAIGLGEKTKSSGFWGSFGIKRNAVKEGVKSVKGAGKSLTNIAQGLISFQDLVDKEISFEKDGKLANAVRNSLSFVGDAFSIIGGSTKEDSALFGLIKWDENLVQQGISNIKGAGSALIDIAEGLITFNKIENPNILGDSIISLFTDISSLFVKTYEKDENFSSHLNDFRLLINDISENSLSGGLEKAGKDIQKIADAINDVDVVKAEAFGNLFKGVSEIPQVGIRSALKSLAESVVKIKEILSESGNSNIGSPIIASAQPQQTPSAVTSNNNDQIRSSLNRLNSTLSNLNTSIDSLPGTIAAIEIRLPEE